MKRKLLSFLTIMFVLITSLALFAACDKGKTRESGEEVGVYYCDVDSAEWTITLSEKCEFTYVLGSDERSGSYYLEETTLRLVYDEKKNGELTATLQDDVITLTYNDAVYRFLKKITYTVTFNTNGGSAVAAAQVVNGKTVARPETDPTLGGKVFIGWYTDNNTFRNEYLFSQPVRGDLTLYARFVEPLDPEFEVTLDLNYENAPEGETLETVGGMVFNLPAPTRTGHEFAGWWVSDFEAADKLTYQYDGQQLFQNTTFYAVWKESGMPLVSVNANGVSWTADGLGNSYSLKITAPNGTTTEQTLSATVYAYDFSTKEAGTYVVEVTLGSKTATAYYNNKALARVSVFSVEGSVLLWNPVPNAESYEVSFTCGTAGHNHVTTPVVVTEANYNFKDCDMVPGGLVFTVKAMADGYATSLPATYTFERTLDAVAGLSVDAATQVVTWGAVSNATSYDVVVTLAGVEVYNANVVSDLSVDLKLLATGAVVVSVTPKAHGWNSPAATVYNYNKTVLAAPSGFALEGYTVKWQAVTGAVGYEVTIGNATYTVDTNEYELDANTSASSLTVYVRALAADTNNNSPLSDAYTVQSGTMSALSYAGGSVSWNAVFGASYYFVTLNDGEPQLTPATSYALTFDREGDNVISVYALTTNGTTAAVTITVVAYALEFDVGTGHDTTPVSTIYLANGDPIPSLEDSTRLGYNFTGWYTEANGGEDKQFTDTTFLGNSTLTLYAGWAPKSFTITLVGDPRYSEEVAATRVVYYEQPYELPVPELISDEMAFLGWADRNGNSYTDYTGASVVVYNNLNDVTLFATYGEIFTWEWIGGTESGWRVSKNIPNANYVKEIRIPAKRSTGEPVTSVSDFSALTNLEVISIPSSIQWINDAVNVTFKSCPNLREVVVYDATEAVGKHEQLYFSDSGALYEVSSTGAMRLAYFPVAYAGGEVFTVMKGTQTIPSRAFDHVSLKEVKLPSSVTYIEAEAFYYGNIKVITFLDLDEDDEQVYALTLAPKSISYLSMLTEITFPTRLYNLPANFLYGSSALENVYVVGDAEIDEYTSVDGLLCKRIEEGLELAYIPRGRTSVELPSGIVVIGEAVTGTITQEDGSVDTMENSTNTTLERITIPATVKLIKRGAFRSASHLNDIEFLGGATDTDLTIKEFAFYQVGSSSGYYLRELTLPENLVKLEKYAFGNISQLTYVAVESVHARRQEGSGYVLDFEEGAFATTTGEYHVTDVYLGKDVPDIKITEVFGTKVARVSAHEANESFASIGDGVLYNKDVTSIRFYPANRDPDYVTPEGLREIPSNVLYGNTSIVNITIGTSVTRIGRAAFQACTNLETVTFVAGGTDPLVIEAYAFAGTAQSMNNTKIRELAFPERTTSIAKYALGYMAGNNINPLLKSISIPDTLETLGEDGDGASAFNGENTLNGTLFDFSPNNYVETIAVTPGLAGKTKNFTVIDNILYRLAEDEKTPYELVYVPTSTPNTNIVASGSVQLIGAHAFYFNATLVNLSFGERATMTDEEGNTVPVPLTIGRLAFYNCTKLENITLPAGLETVVENTFTSCSKLTSVRFSEGLKTVGENAFYLCTTLEYVYLPNTVELLRKGAFRSCSKLTTVEFQEGNLDTPLELEDGSLHSASSMGTGMAYSPGIGVFTSCTSLAYIRLPERTTKIGISAFAGSGLQEIYIPSTVLSIGDEAFYIEYWADGQYSTPKKATKIAKVTFAPDSQLTTIGQYAFYYSANLKTIDLPDTVVSIGQYAFQNSGLTSLNLPKDLTAVNAYAFDGAPITSLVLNDALATIGTYAFRGIATESLTIPASITEIGTYSFSNATIKHLIFAEGGLLTKIADNAFATNKVLETITFAENSALESIGNSSFNGAVALKNLVLPEGLKSIGTNAFQGSTSLTSVTFPSTLETVGNTAFSGCTLLATVNWSLDENNKTNLKMLGESTTVATNVFQKTALTQFKVPASNNDITLGQSLFNGCKNLTNIEISAQVVALDGAFKGCGSLAFIKVDEANTRFSSKDGQRILFDGEGASIVLAYGELDDNFTMDVNATTIGSGAFKGQTKLTYIFIPRSVITIGSEAFMNCINLKEVEFESASSLQNLGYNAFKQCPALEKINLEVTQHIIDFGETGAGTGKGIFYGSPKITTIDLSNNVNLATIPNYAFENLTTLKVLKLPKTGLTKIGQYAFRYTESLTELDLPDSLTTIDNYAFSGAYVQKLTLPANVSLPTSSTYAAFKSSFVEEITVTGATIGNYWFNGAASLQKVKITGAVTSIGNYAFDACSALESVTLPAGLMSLGTYVFRGCSALESIELPATLTSIGTNVFQNSGLTSITIPAGVTALSNYAFSGCAALESIELPATLTSIGTYVFQNSGLTSITIPAGVTSIGNYAFDGCAALTTVTLPSILTTLGTYAFRNSGITEITIPAGITTIGNYTFQGCESLESITFAGAVTSIGTNAFENSGLSGELTLPTGLETIGNSAFHNTLISKVTIPGTVKTLGTATFADCLNLTSVIIEEGNGTVPFGFSAVTTSATSSTLSAFANSPIGELALPNRMTFIPNYAFVNSGITKITSWGGVTNIGMYAFYNTALEELVLPANVTYFTQTATGNPTTTASTYVFRSNASLKKVSFAEGYNGTALMDYMFEGCTSLEEVDFTNAASLVHLGANTFRTTVLTSVDLTPLVDLVYIGAAANAKPAVDASANTFYEVATLKSVKLPANLTHIGGWVFYGCEIESIEGLENVVLIGKSAFSAAKFDLAGMKFEALETLGEFAFQYNEKITSVDFSATKLTAIPAYTFRGATALVSVKLPADVTSIGSYAFVDNSSLESITLPAGVTVLEEGVFQNTYSLTQDGIDLSNVKSIGSFAFFHSGFTKLVLPAGLEYVGGSAFVGCDIQDIDVNGSDFRLENGLFIDGSNVLFAVFDSAVDANGVLTIPAGVQLSGYIFNGVAAEKLVIEDGIETIPANTFFYGHFDELVLPNTLTTIEDGAFRGSFIPSITIPERVTNLAMGAFAEANALEELIFLCDGTLFNGLTNVFQNSTIKRVVLPEGLTKVGNYWFDGTTELEEVVLPESLTDFGTYVFRNSAIKSITLPASLTTSAGTTTSGPFNGSALEEVTILGTIVPNYMFYNAASLSKVTFEGEITSIGNYAFYGAALTEITIPATVESLGTYVFYNNASLESVTFEGDLITSIGQYAFGGTAALESIELPANLTTLGTYAFNGSGIKSITLPASFTTGSATSAATAPFANSALEEATILGTTVPNYMFANTQNLKTVVFGENVQSAGTYVFQNSSVTSVVLNDGLESIGNYAFSATTDLEEVEIPGSVTTLGTYVFYNSSVKNVIFNEGLESIGNYAFRGAAVENVVIPESVTSFGNNMFYDCVNLTSVKLPSSLESIPDYTFKNCSALKYLALPASVTYIGMQTFMGCSSMSAIWISGNLAECYSGFNAFSGWTEDQTIYYEGTAYELFSSVTNADTFIYCGNGGTFGPCKAQLKYSVTYEQFLAELAAKEGA